MLKLETKRPTNNFNSESKPLKTINKIIFYTHNYVVDRLYLNKVFCFFIATLRRYKEIIWQIINTFKIIEPIWVFKDHIYM